MDVKPKLLDLLIKTNSKLLKKKKVLRRIFGPVLDQTTNTWRSLKNSEIESRYAAPNVNQVMKKRRLKYAGHVARTGEDRMPKRVMLDEVSGRRSKGRPKLRWMDNVREDVAEMGMDPDRWLEIAQDRQT